MKAMLISDLQAHQWKYYHETNEAGVNLRILDIVNELSRLCRLAVRNKLNTLIVLGDIFEARNELHISVLNNVYRGLKNFTDHGIRVVLLVGNHDRAGIGTEHALEVFSSFCTVVDKPRILGPILAIPFLPTSKEVVAAIAKGVSSTTRLICAHTSVENEAVPVQFAQWGIPVSCIPDGVRFVSGHYHRFTELIPDQAYFIGSLLQVDSSDAGVDKYFGIYDSKKNSLRFFPTLGPQFVTIDIPESTEFALQQIHETVKGNFVVVESIGEGDLSLGDIDSALRKMGARHVRFCFSMQHTPPPLSFSAQAAGLDHEEVLQRYVQESETALDKEALIEIGTEIVGKVERDTIVEVN